MSPFIIPIALGLFIVFLGPALVWFGVELMEG